MSVNPDRDQPWTGRNWACAQAVKQARGELLLFIDADVRLKPGAIEAAVGIAQAEHIDLLSCLPGIVRDSWSEWLVQPLIFNAIATGFDLAVVNNPQTETAVAAGPFMLFRRSAYKQVGGHRGVAAEVLEDVELSRRIKHSGLKLHMAIGPELATVQMYPTWAALWEGWTKNLYSIFERNGWLTFYVALMMIIMYGVPSLGLALMVAKGWVAPLTPLDYLACSLALTAIVLQYNLRRLGEKITAIPTRYWWLGNLGGLLVAAIALASFIKTETGWGWTWRGRALSLPQFPVERYSSEPAISYFESPVVVDNLTEEVVKDK